jgi:hypothetical protein
MKLDQTPEKETTAMQVNAKKRESYPSSAGNNGSILELLNPLKSININSDLHSFYNFRESKESIEALLKAQSNLVFYVLHQNFMCDELHREFFKNMIGRFYDLPERFWDYFRGFEYSASNSGYPTMLGLVLLENKNLYEKVINQDLAIFKKKFQRIKSENLPVAQKYFNALCLEEYWGGQFDSSITKYFVPSNRKNVVSSIGYCRSKSSGICFNEPYECGRFRQDLLLIKINDPNKLDENYWYKIKADELVTINLTSSLLPFLIKSKGVYASIGLEHKIEILDLIKKRVNELNLPFDDDWIPVWDKEDEKMIRSLSQTFLWSKEYIYENEDLLNLDVLGLNMTVPWDMDLVKFFVRHGYGGRMSENKAVFDKVFKPLLTDEILDMLFRLEYERY